MEVLEKRGYFGFTRIDSGGQATVYKTVLGDMTLAIKVVHIDGPQGAAPDIDLRREILIGQNARHPNIVQFLELFRTRSKLYIVMPFADNGTIGGFVRKLPSGGLCEWNVKAWFCPVCLAVQYLHNRSIAHRDIKLDNILLDRDFNPLLTDFGFSRWVNHSFGKVVLSDTYCGTTSYNPPEILVEVPYDAFKGDVWCLGIALFIMFNKDYPFDRHKGKDVMVKCQMKREYKLNADIEEKMSPQSKQLIDLMLDPNPETRISISAVCRHQFFPAAYRSEEACMEVHSRFKNLKTQFLRDHPENTPPPNAGGRGKKSVEKSKVSFKAPGLAPAVSSVGMAPNIVSKLGPPKVMPTKELQPILSKEVPKNKS